MPTAPENWETIKQLFEAALEQNTDQRSSFLRNHCPDATICAEVERLLAEHELAGTFLSKPPLDAFADDAVTTSDRFGEGQLLAGRFRVVGFIASGGMGSVYEAEDQELRERVALKTIRPEILVQPNAITRFRREVHLARQVTHPHVCRIFDLFRHKSEDGRVPDTVFVSMELLHGPHLGKRLKDSGPMTRDEALPLIRQMGSALAAAHAVGIVHRDFKPGNVVLVGESGRCRAVVTDFGLALRSGGIGESRSISTGQGLVGTLAYMSPEQIEGRPATAASDIYAFGLVIYEMVTGNRPFQGDSPISSAMKRLSQAPIPPRKFNSGIGPVWESVILRCLERDATKRFAQADDVAGMLAGEATTESQVLKSPGKLNRAIIAVLAALLLIAGLLGYEIRHLRANNGQTVTKINPRRSVAVLGFKNLSGKPNEAWLSTALSEMLTTELSAGERLRTVPGETLAQMKTSLELQDEDGYGKDTLVRIQRAVNADDVLVGSYLALGGETGGKVHLDLKLQDIAAGGTTTAIEEDGTEDQLPELVSRAGAALLQKLGVSELTAAQYAELSASVSHNPEANRLYAEGLVKLREFDPLAARSRLEKAVKLDENFALAHSLLSRAWSQLGYDQKNKDEAKRAFDLSGDLSRENRLVIEGRYESAVKDWPNAIEAYKSLYTFFPDNLDYGLLLASAQTSGGKSQDALATIEELRRLPSPSNYDPRIDLQEAASAGDMGDARRRLTCAKRAEQKALSAGLQLIAANARLSSAIALYELGQPKDAMTGYQETLQTYQRLGDRVQVANVYYNMSQALDDMGDRTQARKAAEKGIAIFQEIGNIKGQALLMNEIGIIMRHAGDLNGAIAEYEKSYEFMRRIGDKAGMIAAHGNISNILSDEGDLRGSNEKLEEITLLSIEIGNKRYQALNLENLALNLFHLGDTQQAIADFQKALDLSRQIGNKFTTIGSLDGLTVIHIETGDLVAGSKSAAEGLEISRQSGENAYVNWFIAQQGGIAFIKGDFIEARQFYQEASDVSRKNGDLNAAAQMSSLVAGVALEQGNLVEAEQFARQSVAELDKEKAAMAAAAHATLARVLLAQSKVKEAQSEISLAQRITHSVQDLTVLIPVQIASALVQAESGSATAATQLLQKLVRDCERRQFVNSGFDARLALGEIQMRSAPKDGVLTLQSLEHDAKALGYSLVMNKAQAALKKNPAAEMRLPFQAHPAG
jgi:eukaryotic-like serine/threonine-protein kinase